MRFIQDCIQFFITTIVWSPIAACFDSVTAATGMRAFYLILYTFFIIIVGWSPVAANLDSVTAATAMRAFILYINIILFSTSLQLLVLDLWTEVINFILLLNIFSFILDYKMHSPRLHGASRTTGGIFRGHALGNTLNIADFNNPVDVLHPIPGKVFVYSSKKDPANLSIQDMKPSAFIKHIVTQSIKPVLTKVAEKYSPIQSELFINIIYSVNILHDHRESCFYV